MREFEFKEPILLSLVATPLALLLALFTTGAGHGTYFVAKILFPYTMLSTAKYGTITDPFIVLAFMQFPIYGLILAVSTKSQPTFQTAAKVLLTIHVCAAVLAFIVANESFSP